MKKFNFDELVKGKKPGFSVIPAKAGIQLFQSRPWRDWTPAFAGVTTQEASYETSNLQIQICNLKSAICNSL